MSEFDENKKQTLLAKTMEGIWGSENVEAARQIVDGGIKLAEELGYGDDFVKEFAAQVRGFAKAKSLRDAEDGEAVVRGWLDGFVAAVGASHMADTGAKTTEDFVLAHGAMYDAARSRLASGEGVNLPKLVGDMIKSGTVAITQSKLVRN